MSHLTVRKDQKTIYSHRFAFLTIEDDGNDDNDKKSGELDNCTTRGNHQMNLSVIEKNKKNYDITSKENHENILLSIKTIDKEIVIGI